MIKELKSDAYKVVRKIEKGWSFDQKYYIETEDNEKLLMKVSDINSYESKRLEFEYMKKLYSLDVPMSRPIDFGIYKDNKHVYSLFSWIEGRDAETAIVNYSLSEQYNLGYNAGKILNIIHNTKAPDECEEWSTRYNKKIDGKIKNYNNCDIKIPMGHKMIDYINDNRYLLNDRPQSFHHGDYHLGNMVLSNDNKLSIIDFNRYDFGDPWEEFNRVPFCARISPAFASGRIDGYFDSIVPDEFFRLMALYISVNTISSVPWAIDYGDHEVKTMLTIANKVMTWYSNMKNYIPSWYKKY